VEEIRRLRREEMPISGIGDWAGHDRKAVREYLDESVTALRYRRRALRPSKLEPFKAHSEGRLQSGVWNAVVPLGPFARHH
jgi:hypothetical protein